MIDVHPNRFSRWTNMSALLSQVDTSWLFCSERLVSNCVRNRSDSGCALAVQADANRMS